LTNRLTVLGYIHDNGYLSVTPKANDVLFGGRSVTIRGNKPESEKRERKRSAESSKYAYSDDLFSKLKELRLTIAREGNVPAFVVFSDAALVDMCLKHPQTSAEFLAVSGVGQVKLERYGERFLQSLCSEERNTTPQEKPPNITTAEFLREVEIDENPMQISHVAENINAVLIKYGKSKTGGFKLNNLMLEAGYLEQTDGRKLPTDSGRELGITTVRRSSERGEYTQCLFGAEAQRMCVRLFLKETEV
jgi:ATP-dependent DNA helicase RecQ